MKAVRFHKNGGAEELVYEEVTTPQPHAGEVLIKVAAVGVNYADIIRRKGDPYPEPSPLPFTLGIEVAGTVEAIGEGVSHLSVGMAVMATPGAGGYAQYISVPAAIVIPLPEGVSFEQAASIVAHGLSAALALKKSAKLQAGETILIEAAAGGVGSFAVQLAKHYGAGKVIAAASTPEKRAVAEKLGADATVDYTTENWAAEVKALTDGKGVDIVLETIGGEVLSQALTTLAPFGRMIFLGQSSGISTPIIPWSLTEQNLSVTGFYVSAYAKDPQIIMETLGELLGLIAMGKISVNVGTILPLSAAAEAHRLIEDRKTIGKVVLQPWADTTTNA